MTDILTTLMVFHTQTLKTENFSRLIEFHQDKRNNFPFRLFNNTREHNSGQQQNRILDRAGPANATKLEASVEPAR